MSVHAIDPPAPAPQPPGDRSVEFLGQRFRLRDRGVPLLRLMGFAVMSRRGLNTEDPEGLVAVYTLLQSLIVPEEWDAFVLRGDDMTDDGTCLIQVIKDAVQVMAARPTTPPSSSPDGRSTTGPNLAGGSSSPDSSYRMGDERVQRDLEQRGRPDLGFVVMEARRASTRR